jgi:hypothetical protein
MATFTESQITDLADILETNSDVLSAHLTYHESLITDSDKTKVLSRMSEIQALDTNHSSFTPTESNEGLNLGASSNRIFLANKLAALLHWNQTGTGHYQTVLSRG